MDSSHTSGPTADGSNPQSRGVSGEMPTRDQSVHVARDAHRSKPGDRVGPYTLMELIGEGGFGTVWLAERREPMVQRVAIKIIKPGMDSKTVVARFEQERQALAVMDHPNVAKVFDGGVTERGLPYFVMEYVAGEPITNFCDRHRYTIRQRLELFTSVCDAVQHAHMKGIIHRDIKPSNVLVANASGSVVAKVIDFGVAKAISHTLTEQTIYTETGQIIGTPEYMSPEQAEMGRLDVDTRTDVYSLGVLLYEILTGQLPFDAQQLRSAGHAGVQRILRETDPPRPSTRLSTLGHLDAARLAQARQSHSERLIAELRRELEWIPLMAMRKDRARRYASAEALGADVRRYLEGRPLAAAPESRLYGVRKFVLRQRTFVLVSLTSVALLMVGVAGTLWQAGVAREHARQAQSALGAVQEQEYLNRILSAQYAMRAGDLSGASDLLKGQSPSAILERHRRWALWELRHLSRRTKPISLISVFPSEIDRVPKTTMGARARLDAAARLLRIETYSGFVAYFSLQDPAAVEEPVFTPAPMSTPGTTIRMEQEERDNVRVVLRQGDAIVARSVTMPPGTEVLCCDPARELWAVARPDATIELLQRRGTEFVRTGAISGFSDRVAAAAFDPSVSRLHVVTGDWNYTAVSLEGQPDVDRTPMHDGTTRHVVLNRAGNRLLTTGYDGVVRVSELPSMRELLRKETILSSRDRGLRAGGVAWTLGNDAIVAGTWDDEALFVPLDAEESAQKFPWPASDGSPAQTGSRAVASHPKMDRIAIAAEDRITIFDSSRAALREIRIPPPLFPYAMAWHPDRAILFCAFGLQESAHGKESPIVRAYDAATGDVLSEWPQAGTGLRDIAVSQDGRRVAVASRNGTASVWDWQKQSIEHEFVVRRGEGHHNIVSAVKFDPCEPIVATASHNAQVVFWSLETGRELPRWNVDPDLRLGYGRIGPLKDVEFSTDGKLVYAAVLGEVWTLHLNQDERTAAATRTGAK